MKKLMLILGLCSLVMISCKKEKTPTPSSSTTHNVYFTYQRNGGATHAFKNGTEVSVGGNISAVTGDVIELKVQSIWFGTGYDYADGKIFVDGSCVKDVGCNCVVDITYTIQ